MVGIFTNMLHIGGGSEAEVEYFIVGGGGGGGIGRFGAQGGHGGGGQVKTGKASLELGSYGVTVGAGGWAGNLSFGRLDGGDGASSSFAAFDSAAGGKGGKVADGDPSVRPDTNGGGFGGDSGSGNAGGNAQPSINGGGGGGAQTAASGTSPGSGVSSSLTGSIVEYGKGGSSGVSPTAPGQGGSGSFSSEGLAGANGAVIVRYPGNQRATGGTVTTAGGYTVHVFSFNGALTWQG